MGFWDKEKSLTEAEPFELHEFRLGETDTFWRYADAPADVSYGSQTFLACYIQGQKIEQGVNAIKSRTIVKCEWTNPFAWQYTVCAPDQIIHYTRYKGHGSDVIAIFKGDVLDVVFRQRSREGERWAEIVIDPSTAAMEQMGLVTRYGRQCQVEIYSDLCGVNRDDYKETGNLTAVSGNVLSSAIFGGQANGYWLGGDILVAGRRRKIVAHDGNDITILPGVPGLDGDESFDVWPGCNHLPGLTGDCHLRFSNYINGNYRGQPDIPDRDPHSPWGIL